LVRSASKEPGTIDRLLAELSMAIAAMRNSTREKMEESVKSRILSWLFAKALRGLVGY
jgi:hypothetical protein